VQDLYSIKIIVVWVFSEIDDRFSEEIQQWSSWVLISQIRNDNKFLETLNLKRVRHWSYWGLPWSPSEVPWSLLKSYNPELDKRKKNLRLWTWNEPVVSGNVHIEDVLLFPSSQFFLKVALLHVGHKTGLICTTVYLSCSQSLIFCICPGLTDDTNFVSHVFSFQGSRLLTYLLTNLCGTTTNI
jgi:hypothetical protein